MSGQRMLGKLQILLARDHMHMQCEHMLMGHTPFGVKGQAVKSEAGNYGTEEIREI